MTLLRTILFSTALISAVLSQAFANNTSSTTSSESLFICPQDVSGTFTNGVTFLQNGVTWYYSAYPFDPDAPAVTLSHINTNNNISSLTFPPSSGKRGAVCVGQTSDGKTIIFNPQFQFQDNHSSVYTIGNLMWRVFQL